MHLHYRIWGNFLCTPTIFLNRDFRGQYTNIDNIIHIVYKLLHSFRSQEPSSWLLLYLLDSLLREAYYINELPWLEYVSNSCSKLLNFKVSDNIFSYVSDMHFSESHISDSHVSVSHFNDSHVSESHVSDCHVSNCISGRKRRPGTITDIFLSPMFDCGKTCYYPLQYPQSTLLHIQEIDKALPWFMVLSTR